MVDTRQRETRSRVRQRSTSICCCRFFDRHSATNGDLGSYERGIRGLPGSVDQREAPTALEDCGSRVPAVQVAVHERLIPQPEEALLRTSPACPKDRDVNRHSLHGIRSAMTER